ncbi:hypothetical protein Tco_1497759 [Tanacetum coccineum]
MVRTSLSSNIQQKVAHGFCLKRIIFPLLCFCGLAALLFAIWNAWNEDFFHDSCSSDDSGFNDIAQAYVVGVPRSAGNLDIRLGITIQFHRRRSHVVLPYLSSESGMHRWSVTTTRRINAIRDEIKDISEKR